MLQWAKDHLYTRASDEWEYEALEADPLVHLLVGACASEAQLVYDNIQETEDRLLQRLLRYLLPESFHLPLPTVAVAKAEVKTLAPKADEKMARPVKLGELSDTQRLIHKDGDKSLTFTPLFETTFLNGKVRFVGTDTNIYELNQTAQHHIKNEKESVSRILLGIETTHKITNLKDLAIYIDYKGNDLEKRIFLQALAQSKWTWNTEILQHRTGFLAADEAAINDHFDTEKQLLKRIDAIYQRHFHLLNSQTDTPQIDVPVADLLKAWLHTNRALSPEADSSTAQYTSVTGHFVWLTIQLPYTVKLTDLERHLTVALNHFLVANRSLVVKDDGDTYFNRSLGLEVFPIIPQSGLFLGIREIQNLITSEKINPSSLSELLLLKNKTTYSIRYGGVGRGDSLNTWERLSYMYNLFRKEHRHSELAESLGDKMSLEELHEVLGERIDKSAFRDANSQSTEPPIYVFVRPAPNVSQLRIKAQYWVTDGDGANGLPINTQLVADPPSAGLDPVSIKLVTSTQGGKNRLSVVEQTRALQDTLLRRGRIVSAQDVKSLCALMMEDRLKRISLHPFFETDLNSDGGVRRAMEVSLFVKDSDDPLTQQIAQDIELTLQENSVGTIPYRVRLK
jgi:hypothetical protein